MNKLYIFCFGLFLILFISYKSKAQDSLRLYLNAGYITNFSKCDECEKADDGGSVRIGLLTKGKMAYYIGYAWFKEYHPDYVDYDDKGSLFLFGIDFRLLNKGKFQTYFKLGIAYENYISTYRVINKTETETSLIPDLGLLFNINHFNIYTGWQPSDPSHINLGVGFTINL